MKETFLHQFSRRTRTLHSVDTRRADLAIFPPNVLCLSRMLLMVRCEICKKMVTAICKNRALSLQKFSQFSVVSLTGFCENTKGGRGKFQSPFCSARFCPKVSFPDCGDQPQNIRVQLLPWQVWPSLWFGALK